MASQTPARSWFRLASIARLEAAEAAAAAAASRPTPTPPTPLLPRPPTIPPPQQRPTLPPPLQPPTVQQPPTPPPPPPPTPELPLTPTPPPEIQPQTPTTIIDQTSPPTPKEPQRPPTPPESPKLITQPHSSPPPSPKPKQAMTTPITPPPNPEPEPEPETHRPPPPLPQTFPTTPEEKTVTSTNESKANNVSYSMQKVPQQKEEKRFRVITMAGDNTGAVMDIGSAAPRRLGRKAEQEQMDGKTAAKKKHMEAVVNSNVQGINNSIVLNSSTTQHSPGVHITFASNRKPKGGAGSSSYKEHHSDQIQ